MLALPKAAAQHATIAVIVATCVPQPAAGTRILLTRAPQNDTLIDPSHPKNMRFFRVAKHSATAPTACGTHTARARASSMARARNASKESTVHAKQLAPATPASGPPPFPPRKDNKGVCGRVGLGWVSCCLFLIIKSIPTHAKLSAVGKKWPKCHFLT